MLMGLSICATLGGTISYGDFPPIRRSLPARYTGWPIIARYILCYEYTRALCVCE